MEERSYYFRYVELLRRSDSTEHYFNHFPWQARAVIQNILQYALDNRSDVRVFTGSFSEFYGKHVVEMLKKLGRNETKIEIILADTPTEKELSVLNDLLNHQNNIKVRYMTKYDSTLSHVWLAGNAYRFEKPHNKMPSKITETSPECPAQFAFHNEEQARKVYKYWEGVICAKELVDLRAA